jgi:hypothetical protein
VDDDQTKIEAAAEFLCDDEYALTYAPALVANDGLVLCADSVKYDLDDLVFSSREGGFRLSELHQQVLGIHPSQTELRVRQ